MTPSLRSPLARACVRSAVLLAGLAACSTPAAAQTVSLSLSAATISFASADHDTTPSIASNTLTVTYSVGASGGAAWRITLLASNDFMQGGDAIPASSVTWTATPAPPFRNGTLNRTTPQILASGSGNTGGNKTGTVVFYLANSWGYNTGTFSNTLIFTISCP